MKSSYQRFYSMITLCTKRARYIKKWVNHWIIFEDPPFSFKVEEIVMVGDCNGPAGPSRAVDL